MVGRLAQMYVVVVAEKQTEVRGVETKLEKTNGGLREAEKRGGRGVLPMYAEK